LLRALAFRPDAGRNGPPRAAGSRESSGASVASISGAARPALAAVAAAASPTPARTPHSERAGVTTGVSEPATAQASAPPSPASVVLSDRPISLASHAEWLQVVARLELGGIASQIAHHCDLKGWTDGRLSLSLDPAAEHLRSPGAESRLHAALEKTLGTAVNLDIQVARPERETLARRREREAEERREAAVDTMQGDPVAALVREELDADWIPGSIEPAD
jgi:DNA polymerase III subunit gamma/tau